MRPPSAGGSADDGGPACTSAGVPAEDAPAEVEDGDLVGQLTMPMSCSTSTIEMPSCRAPRKDQLGHSALAAVRPATGSASRSSSSAFHAEQRGQFVRRFCTP